MTPEGAVKKKISQFLKTIPGMHVWMPVPSGYGESSLDYVCCFNGRALYIEAKAPGKKPTARQNILIGNLKRAGAAVFVIDGDLDELSVWVQKQIKLGGL